MPAEIAKIALFKGKNIRRILIKDEWWFSAIGIVAVHLWLNLNRLQRSMLLIFYS